MFVILFYDVGEKRVAKMLKLCRRYLIWIQNSVFEGEISRADLKILEQEIKKIVVEKEGDSVIVYRFRTLKYSEKIVIGHDKKADITFL